MTKAEEIVARVVNAFGTKGYVLKKCPNESYHGEMVNGKKIAVDEVYRHNGTAENASARVVVVNFRNIYNPRIYETKIPYTASDKTINARIEKALEKFNEEVN